MRSQLLRLLVVALVAGPLAGCSSDPEKDYCDELDSATATLVGLADKSGKHGDYVAPALDLFLELRQKSPAELRDEWDTFVFAWQDLVDVLHDTGVDPTTFDPTHRPAGMSRPDFERVRAVGEELRSARVRDAVTGISQHAHDVCGLSLDL